MNFKTILIPSIILVSFMFSKPINRPIKKIDNSNHTSYRNREVQEIVNIDFEGDLSEWTQSTSNGWILTTNSSNSPTHSYNSPDDYNGIHILRSQEIDLPNLSNEEIIQYSFSLNCGMSLGGLADANDYLQEYYSIWVSTNNSEWGLSNYSPTSGSNWWCANQTQGGYLDNWHHYLDTPEIEITSAATMTADMKWGIEEPDSWAEDEVPNSCASAGWDQANVQISTDGGNTWNIIEGSDPYDFECGFGTVYHGFDAMPGWGGIQDWHNVSFNLNSYIGQTIKLRFAFYSDPAYSMMPADDPLNSCSYCTGFQVDNILITTTTNQTLLSDTASENTDMSSTGSSWVTQTYDYCDTDRPGYLGWDTYDPGDGYNNNTLMDLSSFAGETIQFKFEAIYDSYQAAADNGLYIDDLIVTKQTTFNPIPPISLNGHHNNGNTYIFWDDLNISGFGTFIYDNNLFPTSDHIVVSGGDAWAGLEIYTGGTSVVDSIYIYPTGSFANQQLGGFSSFGSTYTVSPDYSKLISSETQNSVGLEWIGVDVDDWIFYGSFIIAQSFNSTVGIAIDPTAEMTMHTKLLTNTSWLDWSTEATNNSLPDGVWGIRPVITFNSPDVTYNVYKNNNLIAQGIQTPYYNDSSANSSSTYTYNVSAVYGSGDNAQESSMSDNLDIIIESCTTNNPGCNCNTCSTGNCILDCSLNCIDALDTAGEPIYSYINNQICDDNSSSGIDLTCGEFLNDGSDCMIDLSINAELEIPKTFQLGQNFPNPFNPTTTIPFAVPTLSHIDLTIYNVLGQQVHSKSFQSLLMGNYEYIWNATHFSSGIYFYTIESNSGIYLKQKMILIK